MSKIDELLKNEKVEWKKLGEVCEIKRGRVISKTYLEQNSGDFPVYSSQTRNNGEIGRINTYDFDGEYATWTTDGAYAGTVFYRNGKFSITNICGLIKPNDSKRLLVKYIVYWLQIEANKHVKSGSGNPKLMSNVVANIKIPIPSLEAQEKIVETLDKFTNYVAELQAELQARNKQYEYYRDMLLSEKYLNNKSMELFIKCNNSIKKCKLKNVAEITRGKRLVRSDLEEIGKFPVFQNSLKPLGYYYDKNFPGDKTCVISAGAAGEIFYRESDFWAADDVFVINSDLILNKYIYYFLLSKKRLIKSRVRKASIPRLSREEIERLEILIPSIELQTLIVEVLDKFQYLLSDTQGLLPEEIEQRQKQYEYYREKLLTFEDKSDSKPQAASRKLTLRSYFATLKQACDIVGVCFAGVEWKKLGDIGTFENGTGMPKSLFKENGSVGAIHYGHIYTKYNLFVDKPLVQVSEDDIERLKKVNYGDLVIAKTSENVDDVMKTVAYLGDKAAVTGGHAAIFRHDQNPKYLSYVFNGADYLLKQKNKFARGVKVIELSINEMEKIKIPLPSLIVQDYVVSILDKFDKLVNDINEGLPKEIELRQKQYEYYRERLLNFPK